MSRRYRVIAADWDVVRVLIEKRHTYELAERHGIPCPRMRVTRDEGEAMAFAHEVGFPCLLKPSVGHAFFNRYRAKMLMVHDAAMLRQTMGRACRLRRRADALRVHPWRRYLWRELQLLL